MRKFAAATDCSCMDVVQLDYAVYITGDNAICVNSIDHELCPRLGRRPCSYSIQPVRLHVDHTELRHKTGRVCKGNCYGRGVAKRSARNLDCGSSEMKST